MATSNNQRFSSIGRPMLQYRLPIALILLAVTAFMGYWALGIGFGTGFQSLFPSNSRDAVLYREYKHHYGGADNLLVMLRVRHGDIFNLNTLRKIQLLTEAVNVLPGVNHNEVFSLASLRVSYSKAVPGGLESRCFMYPRAPTNQKQVEELRSRVLAHRAQAAGVVTPDNKGALIVASFNKDESTYPDLFRQIRQMVNEYSGPNTRIFLGGQIIVTGQSYYYLPRIYKILGAAILMMLLALYLILGRRSIWWTPVMTSSLSAIWGLGFMGLMGYNFDAITLIVPFFLIARDLSHSIQWQGRYYEELDRLDDKLLACASTTDAMLPPGALAILADIVGLVFISFGGIPFLTQVCLDAAVWLIASLLMVFVFQPVVLSYLPRPRLRVRRLWRQSGARQESTGWLSALTDRIARPLVKDSVFRTALVAGAAAVLVVGIISSLNVQIEYNGPGTPLYSAHSKINRDIEAIARYFPPDVGWIVLKTPDYPDQQSSISPEVLRMTDDMSEYLVKHRAAPAVLAFANVGIKPLNSAFHYGFPKFRSVSDGTELGGNLWGVFFAATAPGEIERYFAYSPHMTSSCVRVLLPNHNYARLERLHKYIKRFVAERVSSDPELNQVKVSFLGGEAGLYLAAERMLFRLDLTNIAFVMLMILLCGAIVFRSPIAGILFVIASAAANLGAFAYMDARGMALSVETIPILSLGIGLGIDYGFYTVARIREEVQRGSTLDEAVGQGLRKSGSAVLCTFLVIAAAIVPWCFSPSPLHNQMGLLLLFLVGINMVAGILFVPAVIAWRRPKFISGFVQLPGAARAEE